MGPEYMYLAFVFLVQIGTFVWWGSNISTRIKQVEKDVTKIGSEFDALTKLEIRLTVVETILDNQTRVLREIRDEIKVSNSR